MWLFVQFIVLFKNFTLHETVNYTCCSSSCLFLQYMYMYILSPHGYVSRALPYMILASYPGAEEGEEKKCLVYTVCTCVYQYMYVCHSNRWPPRIVTAESVALNEITPCTCRTWTLVWIVSDDSHHASARANEVLYKSFPCLTAGLRGSAYYWQYLANVTVLLVCTYEIHTAE